MHRPGNTLGFTTRQATMQVIVGIVLVLAGFVMVVYLHAIIKLAQSLIMDIWFRQDDEKKPLIEASERV